MLRYLYIRLQISLTYWLLHWNPLMWRYLLSWHYVYEEDWAYKRQLRRQVVRPRLLALRLQFPDMTEIFSFCACCFHILLLFRPLSFWTSIFPKKSCWLLWIFSCYSFPSHILQFISLSLDMFLVGNVLDFLQHSILLIRMCNISLKLCLHLYMYFNYMFLTFIYLHCKYNKAIPKWILNSMTFFPIIQTATFKCYSGSQSASSDNQLKQGDQALEQPHLIRPAFCRRLV